MSIVLYTAPFSSASPVVSALVELGVPFERVTLEFAAGEQRRPEFLKLNPNGKVPTLVVDGTPMFEALAILLWLGETYGVKAGLWPARRSDDEPRKMSRRWFWMTHFVAARHQTSGAKRRQRPCRALCVSVFSVANSVD